MVIDLRTPRFKLFFCTTNQPCTRGYIEKSEKGLPRTVSLDKVQVLNCLSNLAFLDKPVGVEEDVAEGSAALCTDDMLEVEVARFRARLRGGMANARENLC